jgi:hypothetical protein
VGGLGGTVGVGGLDRAGMWGSGWVGRVGVQGGREGGEENCHVPEKVKDKSKSQGRDVIRISHILIRDFKEMKI